MNRVPHHARRLGFSLIEVNMAILVIAGGILSLIALFPAGMRLSILAMSDTRQALYAKSVFSAIQGASENLSADRWVNISGGKPDFWNDIVKNKTVKDLLGSVDSVVKTNQAAGRLTWYAEGVNEGYFCQKSATQLPVDARWIIRLDRTSRSVSDPSLDALTWRLSMVVSDIADVEFSGNPVYHTEIRYTGNP